jgi:2-isopropylmalate synthase
MDTRQHLSIFDTTLRDGEQAPGNTMSIRQKLRLATEVEALGVNVIEAGFPAASDVDFNAVRAIAQELRRIKICVFARAIKRDIERAAEASEAANCPQIEILSSVSDIHLKYKRKISRQQALDEIAEAVDHAKRLGFTDVAVAPEDATRADLDFLRSMTDVVVQAGATLVGLPDTVGCFLPHQTYELIATVKEWLPPGVKLAYHGHDDLGLATANTLAAIEAGVDEIQTTLCGIGERAGNCALEEVIAALLSHPSTFNRTFDVVPSRIFDACKMLIDEIELPLARGKAVVGKNAFTTAAGLHQAGIIRNPITYEFLDPSDFGACRSLVITRHSGHQALVAKLEALALPQNEELVESIYHELTKSGQSICGDDQLRSLVRSRCNTVESL